MPAQNSTKTAERVVGRPFPRGVSGNPGGRPRGLVSRIREETDDGEEIVTFMVAVLRAENAARRPGGLRKSVRFFANCWKDSPNW